MTCLRNISISHFINLASRNESFIGQWPNRCRPRSCAFSSAGFQITMKKSQVAAKLCSKQASQMSVLNLAELTQPTRCRSLSVKDLQASPTNSQLQKTMILFLSGQIKSTSFVRLHLNTIMFSLLQLRSLCHCYYYLVQTDWYTRLSGVPSLGVCDL